MKCLSSDVVTNGGPVEDIKLHPYDDEKILIGYKKGLIVLWNQDKIKIESYFMAKQYIESVYWNEDCSGFISAQKMVAYAFGIYQNLTSMESYKTNQLHLAHFLAKLF